MTKNRHKIPKLEWRGSAEEQTNCFCHVAHTIINCEYVRRNFLVLPYQKYGAANTIYFPDLPYPKNFWRDIKRNNINVGQKFPRKLIKEITLLLPQKEFKQEKRKIIDVWEKLWPTFWDKVIKSGLFKEEIKKLNKVVILLTPFGPGAQFCDYPLRRSLYLTFREDRQPEDLGRSLFSALILMKNGRPQGSENKWQENKTISDFMLKSGLAKEIIYPSITLSDRKASRKFLKKLGLGLSSNFKIKDTNVFYGEKNLSRRLSLQQNLILRELILLAGKILTHDRLAEILWTKKEYEKFSLQAIAKAIEKLREKLENARVNPRIIETVYGQGYVIRA